jgi:hypothetical protein
LGWIFPLALAVRLFDCSFKRGWPGASVVKIKDGLRYHLQGANATDKNVVSYTKQKLMISATTLPTKKKMRYTQQLSEVKL